MIKVLTTKEYNSIKKPIRKRYYELIYWIKDNKITVTMPFNNYTHAYKFIYQQNCLPLTVKFIGWL